MAYGLTPISNTNVETVVGIEAVPGVVATNGKIIAYEQNTLVPNQTMEKNVELRGNRQMGTRVPGMKNPGGTLLRHETDLVLPLSYYALMGKLVSSELGAAGIALTVSQSASVGSTPPEAGAHSYVVVLSKGGSGLAKRTLHSGLNVAGATVTADGTHKVTVARSGGTLPTGWTWAIYRTEAGDDPAIVANYKLVTGTIALAANVVSFDDDVADAALGAAVPTASDTDYADFKHIITPGDDLPGLSVQKKFPYLGGAAEYFLSLGCFVNKGTVKMIGAGFYDIGLDFLNFDYDGPNASSFDPAALDWRGGEKLHHAMLLAGDVLLDDVAFAKFIDLTIAYMNNLDTSDHPVGAGGGLGSLAPQQAEAQITATVKVTDPDVVALARNTSLLHKLSTKHSFATFGHYIKHDVFGISFDPTAPAPQGQGILKFSLNGFASQPDGGDELSVEIVNGQPNSVYTT